MPGTGPLTNSQGGRPYERWQGNLRGRNLDLDSHLASAVLLRQARDGDLCRAVGSDHPQPGSDPNRRRLEPVYSSGFPGPSDRGSTELRLDRVLRSLGLRGYRKSRVRQWGWGPSFVGLRPLGWLSRGPTTSEGVFSEQEHDYHGDCCRVGNLADLCATAVPLRSQAGLSRARPLAGSATRHGTLEG